MRTFSHCFSQARIHLKSFQRCPGMAVEHCSGNDGALGSPWRLPICSRTLVPEQPCRQVLRTLPWPLLWLTCHNPSPFTPTVRDRAQRNFSSSQRSGLQPGAASPTDLNLKSHPPLARTRTRRSSPDAGVYARIREITRYQLLCALEHSQINLQLTEKFAGKWMICLRILYALFRCRLTISAM